MIRFGPSGNCDAFYAAGYKESIQMPEWLNKMGLNAYEYSFTLGRYLSDSTARILAQEAQKYNVKISVHGPYYINFCNDSDVSIENNTKFILNSVRSLKILGGDHCVFHIGAQMKLSRQEALSNLEKNFKDFLEYYHKLGDYEDIYLCPETMGKYSQIGTPSEIFRICNWDKNLIPTLDFGHINCIMQGALKNKTDFIRIFEEGIETIGFEKMKKCHIHFSKIKYGPKGEIAHLTFDDNQYGPNYEPFLESIIDLGLEPTVISESKGTQGPDAKVMSEYYKSCLSK